MYIDSHCHLDAPSFDHDREAVLARARMVGVSGWILAGVSPKTWGRQHQLASQQGIAWTQGLHPVWVAHATDQAIKAGLDALGSFSDPMPCAIGEMGLDRRAAPRSTLAKQRTVFQAQLAFARATNQPVILHIVAAHGAALDLLKRDGLPIAGGVVHGFSGAVEVAKSYLDLGLHIGLGGMAARPQAKRLLAAVPHIPIERLLFETDSPDQALPDAPDRNESSALIAVADAVATHRSESAKTLLQYATDNAIRLFDLRGHHRSWQSHLD